MQGNDPLGVMRTILGNSRRAVPLAAVLVACLSACAGAPVISPDRWIETYDYRGPLTEYLKSEYSRAVAIRRVPYVYIYGDWCAPCRQLRHAAKTDPSFAGLFDETQIVMLEYDQLVRIKGAPTYGGVPIIAPLNIDGTLGETVLYGIPWKTSLPRDIKHSICSFLNLRKHRDSTLERNCEDVARRKR